MPQPRSEIVIPSEKKFYHCISRCVRRAHLCGKDKLTGKCYEHRRGWVRTRLFELLDVFAIELGGYAILSSHLHTLLRNRPDIVDKWDDEEVARRWCRLFPGKRSRKILEDDNDLRIELLVQNKERIKELRKRLSCLSWFNRCLNEYIARLANKEDECTGRFWEGRFKSIRIDDIGGVLACGVYIDLNPIRAGMAKTPESSDFTSIQDRINAEFPGVDMDDCGARIRSQKLLSPEELTNGFVSTQEYIELVDKTGRQYKEGKAEISSKLEPILTRLQLRASSWVEASMNIEKIFNKIIGTKESLRLAAQRARKSRFNGLKGGNLLFSS